MTNRLTLLYKAFDDVSLTIRALDAKASYLLAIVIFLGGSYFGLIKELLGSTNPLPHLYYLPFIVLVSAICFYIYSLIPRINPTGKLEKSDIEFAKNKFFIPIDTKPIGSQDIFQMDESKIEEIERIIAIEILQLSYIRDTKIKYIKCGTNAILLFIFFATLIFIVKYFYDK